MPDRRELPQLLPSSRPCGWPTTRPLTPPSGRPRRKSWRNASGGNSDAATVATAGIAPVGVVAPGVATKMVGVATTTTAAGVAAVVEAREARRVMAVAQGAGKGAALVSTTGAMAAAVAVATESGGTAREDVQRGTARQPPPDCLRPRAPRRVDHVLAGNRCRESWQKEHLGLSLLPFCWVC